MKFTIEQNDPTVIAITGDVLGGADAMEFSRAINEQIREGAHQVIVDLSEVHLMNSSGLGMLVAASTSLRSSGGRLMVVGANERIKSLLKMTRLDSVFASYETRDAAVEACRQTN
jgi:anti-sigma B factor antagonist